MSEQDAGATAVKTLVLLCTYNEAGNIEAMFERIFEHLPQTDVLVVDDNSPDGTADLVKKAAKQKSAIHLVLRAGKEGLGTATRAGLAWGVQHGYDYIINLDADQSHDPAKLPDFLVASRAGADVVVGSRYAPGGGRKGLAWHRKLISRALNGYARRVLGMPIRDCSGSYRCYSREALERIELSNLTCPGYGFLEEILVALADAGCSFAEVPIQFHDRGAGQSKLSASDAWGAIKIIHKLAFRRRG
ncbi:MAG TPA: hypothetical protein DDW52_05210 [Planctomycetaceae bacterium]|nr:hypothetical protein [Planctomycetaceae bacterium]